MATPTTGQVTSYELAAGVKINMDELIYMYSPMDLPMTLGVDAQDTMVVGKMGVDQTSFSWMDEEMLVPRVLVAAAATTAETAITVTTNEGRRFSTGDLARLIRASGAQEVVRVTGVATSALTVTRGYASTTAGSVVTGDVLIGIGTALAEGSNPEAARVRDRDFRTNYTQIFGPLKIDMTATEQVITKYGVNDEWAKQTYLRTKENWMRIEQALLYGVANNDTSNKIRATGGWYHFITSNVSTSTQFTVANITALQEDCFQAGGVPPVAVVNPVTLSDLNDTENTSRLRVTYDDSRRGRRRVETLDTEYGTLTIIRNRYVHPHNAFLVRPGATIRRILRPMQYQSLAKTGDADSAQIVGEEGFEIKGQAHMAKFTTLTSYTGV